MAITVQTAVASAGTLYFIHPDDLDTPRQVSDATGKVVWQWEEQEPFGLIAPLEDPDADAKAFVLNLRFAGQYFDAESRLHHNVQRDYDPATGRYVQADPIGLDGGISLYGYVGGNPLGFVDPLGLAANPALATHIQYEGLVGGKPYIGYASKPGLGNSAESVLNYRYSSNFARFDQGTLPDIKYVGDGKEGKNVARGLEHRRYEDLGGKAETANRQAPVGERNEKRTDYLRAADNHRRGGKKGC